MASPNITVQMRKENATTCVLEVRGEVNAQAEAALMDAYTNACAAGAKNVVLDFSGLEYMNSTGIGLLVTLLIRIKRQNQRLLATGLNQHYQQIFELTRLNEAITLIPNLQTLTSPQVELASDS